MQRGTIIKHRASWALLYYDWQFRDGRRKRVRVSKKLAFVSKEYPTKASVRQLADDILRPLNKKQLVPESSLLITDFIETRYFPAVKAELKPSTVMNYEKSVYYPHLKHRLGKLRLRDFRTQDAQRILRDIPDVGHNTLLHVKNFLSGVFKFCRREGALDTANPVTDAKTPGRPVKFHGAAYSMEDCEAMVERIKDETATDVIVLLSLTGLRTGEARALRWADWDEQQQALMVSRAVWRTHVGTPKNLDSENIIPVLPLVADVLRNRRNRLTAIAVKKGKTPPGLQDYIFAGERRGGPLNFHNLQYRVIAPELKDSGVEWKGMHGFRRGLATNLLELGVNPVVIARILRHSDVATTLAFYAKSRDAESRTAMDKLEEKIRNRPSGITFGTNGGESPKKVSAHNKDGQEIATSDEAKSS
jgi:integrase